MGYSTQERLISMLLDKCEDKIDELPNVLFYELNDFKKIYLEIDRILMSQKEIFFPKIKVYYKCKYTNNIAFFEEFKNGEMLKFEENSLNFIEVKSSINGLIKDMEKEKENKLKHKEIEKFKKKDNKKVFNIINKTPSSLSSKTIYSSTDMYS